MTYELTPEHRAQLEPWAQRWIANTMSTEPMTEADKAACVEAVHGLYAAADLPPPKHVVFVPSPFVLAFAGGFAAAIWHASRHGWPESAPAMSSAMRAATADATADATYAATRAATRDATRDATEAATEAATYAATVAAAMAATRAVTDSTSDAPKAATAAAAWNATKVPTKAATETATWSATWDAGWLTVNGAPDDPTESSTWRPSLDEIWNAAEAATRAATRDATEDVTRHATQAATGRATVNATRDAWYEFPCDVRSLADRLGVGRFGLACAAQAWRMWQGGNQWSYMDAFLSFYQDVVKLPIDYSKYRHWRTLAERSGPRIVHPDFCMISDRPERLLVDEQNRPHCDDGPFCRWRDGSALYAIHGVRVPKQVVEAPETLTAEQVRAERNAEVRRIMLDRYGGLRSGDAAGKWLEDIGAQPADVDKAHGWLYRADLADDEPLVMLRVTCPSTGRVYFLRVPPEVRTAREARAWTFGKAPATFAPETET